MTRQLTEEEAERARSARLFEVVKRWKHSLPITRLQLERIRPIIGETNYQETLAEMAEVAPISEADTPTRGHCLHELKDYAATYRRPERQQQRSQNCVAARLSKHLSPCVC